LGFAHSFDYQYLIFTFSLIRFSYSARVKTPFSSNNPTRLCAAKSFKSPGNKKETAETQIERKPVDKVNGREHQSPGCKLK
jgi:hypothetical protein